MAKNRTSPGDNGGAAGFEPFCYILNVVFWGPVLYTVFAPWLSFAVIKFWSDPILAGFFNAMASTGWLVASGLVCVAVARFIFGIGAPKRKPPAAKS